MARDSYRASTDSIAVTRGRDNAINTIASVAVAAPPTKIATKLLHRHAGRGAAEQDSDQGRGQ
jgi:hypothetical protein